MYGEYWIDDNGHTTFCDGNAGLEIPNHSMVVIGHCCQLAIDKLQIVGDEFALKLIEIINQCYDGDIIDTVMFRVTVGDIEIDTDNIFDLISDRYGIDRWLIDIITGSDEDPRVAGIMKLGWIRVIGNNFNVKSLNKRVLSHIQDFIVEEELSGTFSLEVMDHNGHRLIAYDLDAAVFNSISSIMRKASIVSC